MKSSAQGDAAGRPPEAGGLRSPPGVGFVSLLGEGVRGLMRAKTRKLADNGGVDPDGFPASSRPDTGAARSHMDAGITGGVSLLLNGQRHRDGRR